MDPSQGSFVPILPFTDDQEYVERILDYASTLGAGINQTKLEIEVRRQAELIIDVAKALNSNTVETGQLIAKTSKPTRPSRTPTIFTTS